MQGIDPKWTAYLGLAVIIEQGIGHGTVSLTNLIPADWAPYVTSWANFLAFVGTAIMTYQAGFSGPQSGPMLPDIPKIVPTIAKILLIAFLPLAVLGSGSAQAQTKLKLPIDPLHLNGTPVTGNASVDMQAIWQKIVASSITDLNYAAAMASSANTSSSAVRLQCLKAIITLNEQASGANLKNPDGTPMVKPDPHLFTDVESLAEIVDNLSPQGPLFVNCAGAAQLAKTNVLSFVNAVVTGAAGLAAMPVIPGL